MLDKDILSRSPTVLSRSQQQQYFDDGCLVLPALVPEQTLERLRSAMRQLVESSRTMRESDETFVLERDHSPENPKLHRVINPQDRPPAFREFFTGPVMVELAADVVGPDVKFYHSKLNIKSGKGSSAFDWHQDIVGWPHTDFSPATVGIYLEDCSLDQGPLMFVLETNHGDLYRIHDDRGEFVGTAPEVIAQLDKSRFLAATGSAGTVALVNCRVIHGSGVNHSPLSRPLLPPVYTSADSFCYVENPIPTPRAGEIVKGNAARFASFDTRPCPMPPDWPRKKSNPWPSQAREEIGRSNVAGA
jgi:ectoine hydroxylase